MDTLQAIYKYLRPWTSNTFHSHFYSNIGIFLIVLIVKLIFFLFFLTIYNEQKSFNISNPTAGTTGREQAFVFGYVTTIEGLHRTYLIESSIQI